MQSETDYDMDAMTHWSDGEGYPVHLQIKWGDAQYGSQQGQCDSYIKKLLRLPYIREQFDNLETKKDMVIRCLRGYGLITDKWEQDEWKSYLLWVACCDIRENAEMYLEDE